LDRKEERNMPKVYYVKKAIKDNPVAKKGESYYWWRHAFGAKEFSKERPKPSQITGSPWLSELYSLQEQIEATVYDFDELETMRDDTVSSLEELRDQAQDSLDNMPEHLQETSQSGEMLQERIDELESAISDLESLDVPDEEDKSFDNYNESEPDWKEEQAQEFKQAVLDAFPSL